MEFSITEIYWIGVIIATVAYSAFTGIWHKNGTGLRYIQLLPGHSSTKLRYPSSTRRF